MADSPSLAHNPPADDESLLRKFGKQIQKRQLEVPEYAASFVNYKALKKVRDARLLAINHSYTRKSGLKGPAKVGQKC
jgi:hypothetical protein